MEAPCINLCNKNKCSCLLDFKIVILFSCTILRFTSPLSFYVDFNQKQAFRKEYPNLVFFIKVNVDHRTKLVFVTIFKIQAKIVENAGSGAFNATFL